MEEEKGFTSSLGCFSGGEPTERHVDSNQPDFPGLLCVCLQASVHLNATSLFIIAYFLTLHLFLLVPHVTFVLL